MNEHPNFSRNDNSEEDLIFTSIPDDLLGRIDNVAALFDLTRDEVINRCLVFGLENMEIVDEP